MPAAKACLPFPASPASRQAVRGGASARSRLGRVCKRGWWAVGACAPWGAGREGGPLQGRCGPPQPPPPESALPVSLVHSHGAVGPGEQVRSSPGPRRLIQAPGAHPGQGLVRLPLPPAHTRRKVCLCERDTAETRVHTRAHTCTPHPSAPPIHRGIRAQLLANSQGDSAREGTRAHTHSAGGAHALCGGRAPRARRPRGHSKRLAPSLTRSKWSSVWEQK